MKNLNKGMIMTCPYCGEKDFVPDYVVGNVAAYGSRTVRFGCKKCNNVVQAYARRTVEIERAQQTDKESDW